MNLPKKVAEIKISYSSKVPAKDRFQIKSSKDAEKVLRQVWEEDLELRERFKIIILNRANHAMGICEISSGGINGTVVDAKLVFGAALKASASSLILAHNHPSGNLRPSQADVDLTRKLRDAGNLLDIQVLDHLILAPEGYYSFADEGMI